MARTILGLVNWADGKVYFGDPPCDTRIACIDEDVEGCVEWTGDHANQVKVTITQADIEDCNDTYYGCVDWTTRKFQITIPDSCCESGDDCGFCDADDTPANVRVIISGVSVCPDCVSSPPSSARFSDLVVNDTYVAPQTGNPCAWWLFQSPQDCLLRSVYPSVDCTGTPEEFMQEHITIQITRLATKVTAIVYAGIYFVFSGEKSISGTDPCVAISGIPNGLTCGGVIAGSGGTVTVEEI